MPDLLGTLPVPLVDQITEVERELRQRERVYPRLIAAGTLSRPRAELQTRALQAVLDTLLRLHNAGKP